eukprot:Gb_22768 [translate_table: standard]
MKISTLCNIESMERGQQYSSLPNSSGYPFEVIQSIIERDAKYSYGELHLFALILFRGNSDSVFFQTAISNYASIFSAPKILCSNC